MFVRAFLAPCFIAACLLATAIAEDDSLGLEIDDGQPRIFSHEIDPVFANGIDPCDDDWQSDLQQAIADYNARSDNVFIDSIDFHCDDDDRRSRKLQGWFPGCVPGLDCPDANGICLLCPPGPPLCDDVHNGGCPQGMMGGLVGVAINEILMGANATNLNVRRRALSTSTLGVKTVHFPAPTTQDVAIATAVNANVTVDSVGDKIKTNVATDDADDAKARDVRKAIRKLKKKLEADDVADKDKILLEIEHLEIKLKAIIAERKALRKSHKKLNRILRKAKHAKAKADAILADKPNAKARLAKLQKLQADAIAMAKKAATDAAKGSV